MLKHGGGRMVARAVRAATRTAKRRLCRTTAFVLIASALIPSIASAQTSGTAFNGPTVPWSHGFYIGDGLYSPAGMGTNGMSVNDGGFVDFEAQVNDYSGNSMSVGFFKGFYNYSNCNLATVTPTFVITSETSTGMTCQEYNGDQIGGYEAGLLYWTGSGSTWDAAIGNASATIPWAHTNREEQVYTQMSSYGNLACDYARGLQWYDTSNNLHQGWKDGAAIATIFQSQPPYAYFYDHSGDAGYPSIVRMYAPSSESSCF